MKGFVCDSSPFVTNTVENNKTHTGSYDRDYEIRATRNHRLYDTFPKPLRTCYQSTRTLDDTIMNLIECKKIQHSELKNPGVH